MPITPVPVLLDKPVSFEVACEVENKGGRIDRLIILDSYRRLETADVARIRHEKDMLRILSSDEYSVFFPDKSSRKTAEQNGVAYAEHLCSGIEKGSVDAHIILIRADDDVPDPSRDRFGALRSRLKWEELTGASFHIMNGSGSHDEMLKEKNSKLNGAIVRQILSDTMK